jgi:hypothetical protein
MFGSGFGFVHWRILRLSLTKFNQSTLRLIFKFMRRNGFRFSRMSLKTLRLLLQCLAITKRIKPSCVLAFGDRHQQSGVSHNIQQTKWPGVWGSLVLGEHRRRENRVSEYKQRVMAYSERIASIILFLTRCKDQGWLFALRRFRMPGP